MLLDQLKPNTIVRGPIFPEPVQVIVAIPMGTSVKLIGKGLNTNHVHEPILSAEQLAQLVATPDKEPFDGDHTHPYNMSYGMMWDYVLEYENTNVPAELQHELNGDQVQIGMSLDESGRPSSCSDLTVWEDPNQQAVSVSPSVKAKATEVLCSSIRTWKFRAFRYCDRAVPVRGPLVFIVLDQKFTLKRIGTGPVERKTTK